MVGVRFESLRFWVIITGLMGAVFLSPTGHILAQLSDNRTASDTTSPGDEQVVEVRVAGNQTVSVQKVLAQVKTRAGRPFDPQLVQRDVRQLATKGWFLDVEPRYQQVPGGRVVIFHVTERPTLRYVKYLGNAKIKDKALTKQTDLKVGDAVDPYAVEEGRRSIEEFYQSRGYNRVQVEVIEGNRTNDHGAVYVINEGQTQRVLHVNFIGNTIASDSRLKTQIQSKPGILWLFKGYVDRKKIDADVDRLTAYYRSLGFFRARIGRELKFNQSGSWLTLTFVIDEGPRYEVRNVQFMGNEVFSQDTLSTGLRLTSGEHFDQGKMNRDLASVRDIYGSEGYVFADVQADPRFLEEPGQLDLVYKVEEGSRYRVGRINVNITGENPHTQTHAVLDRLSLRPGDYIDVTKVRNDERRLAASQLFERDAARGISPKITIQPPDTDETDLAKRPRSRGGFRGQSPDRPAKSSYESRGTRLEGSSDRLPPPVPINPYKKILIRHQSPEFSWSRSAPATQYGGQGLRPVAPGGQVQSVYNQRPITERPRRSATVGTRANPPRTTSAASYPGQPVMLDPPRRRNHTVYQNPYGSPGSTPVFSPPPSANGGAPRQMFAPPPVHANPVSTSSPSGQFQTYPDPYNGGLADPRIPFINDPTVPIDIDVQETQTGRFMLGVGVNSDAGVVGSVVIDERNFDWRRIPTGFEDIRNGTAFRGAGEHFRVELLPGTQVQRYMINWSTPYLNHTPVSLGLSGFFFDRRFEDWDEQRLGGRVSLGYQLAPDLSTAFTYRGENVSIHDPRIPTPPEVTAVLGDNVLHGFKFALTNDTRDNSFLATSGHLIELSFEQVVGTFSYPRGEIDVRQYFLIRERPDGSGRHVMSFTGRLGVAGDDTPVYDNFFAGGFTTLRGFDFRGASPRTMGVAVGGEFLLLGSAEYLLPITADDMLQMVGFVDVGTVEKDVEINDFRVSPGLGLRISVPALGPAPIALDFAVPVVKADFDDTQVFSFTVGFLR